MRTKAVIVLKILTEPQWRDFVAAGRFDGAAVDLRDGYVHLSAPDQLAETAAKHFAGQEGLRLVALSVEALGAALRWEPSRGGALFPHLYGPMLAAHLAWSAPLPLGPDGRHRLPPELSA